MEIDFNKKRNIFTTLIVTLAMALLFTLSGSALAGDDPSIKEKLRNKIHASMDNYIKQNTINGIYAHFDPVTGKLLRMKMGYLHSGIVKQGDFFISCADMIDQDNGKVVDMDFFVRNNFGEFVTTQAIVHKADGKKRKYQLETVKTRK